MMLPGVHSFIKDYAYNDDDNDDRQQNALHERPDRPRQSSPIYQLTSSTISRIFHLPILPPGVRPIIMLMMLFFENFLHCLSLLPFLPQCSSSFYAMFYFILFHGSLAVRFIFSSFSFSSAFLLVWAIKVCFCLCLSSLDLDLLLDRFRFSSCVWVWVWVRVRAQRQLDWEAHANNPRWVWRDLCSNFAASCATWSDASLAAAAVLAVPAAKPSFPRRTHSQQQEEHW